MDSGVCGVVVWGVGCGMYVCAVCGEVTKEDPQSLVHVCVCVCVVTKRVLNWCLPSKQSCKYLHTVLNIIISVVSRHGQTKDSKTSSGREHNILKIDLLLCSKSRE